MNWRGKCVLQEHIQIKGDYYIITMALKNVFRSTVLGLRTWSVFAGARQGKIVVPAFKQTQCSFYANLTVTGICKRKY